MHNKSHRIITTIAAAFLFAASSLCSSAQDKDTYQPHAGIDSLVFSHDGLARGLIIHLPDSFCKDSTYPVVFAYHGMGGNNRMWPRAIADQINKRRFAGIYLQGVRRSWNSGSGMEPSKADDVGLTEEVLQWLATKIKIDRMKCYGLGRSNGAALCHRLALESSCFAAICAMAANLLESPEFNPEIPRLSVLQIHGEQDQVVPYEGGLSSKLGISFESSKNSVALWALHNGCSSAPSVEPLDGGITIYRHIDCQGQHEVLLYSLANAGHGIPRETAGGLFELVFDFFERNYRR